MAARCFPAKRFPAVVVSPRKNLAANRVATQTAALETIAAAIVAVTAAVLAVVVAAAIGTVAIRSASAPRRAWIPPKQFFPQ